MVNLKKAKSKFIRDTKARKIKGLYAYSIDGRCPLCGQFSLVTRVRKYNTYPNKIREVRETSCVMPKCYYKKFTERLINKKKRRSYRKSYERKYYKSMQKDWS